MKKSLALFLAAALLLPGCVKVDNTLGKGLIDKSLLFDTYTATFPLTEIQLKYSSDLSGYSSSHLTVGAIRDDVFGLTTREAAFCLVPALDTLDLGDNPVAQGLKLYFTGDTVSCNNDSEARIFQNFYVTELTRPLPTIRTGCMQDIPHGDAIITNGIPVFDGLGGLTLSFTQEYAQKYVDILDELGPYFRTVAEDDDDNDIDKLRYEVYVQAVPGIHIRTDVPDGPGGRINLFEFSSLSVESNRFYLNSNVAELTVTSTWNGVRKDSTILMLPGEPAFLDEDYYIEINERFPQFCFNRSSHSTLPGQADEAVYVEGGGGLKPVILARELQEKTSAEIARLGGKPEDAIIIKATIGLPFEMPEDYRDLKYYPSQLSPTICKMVTDIPTLEEYPTFAGLTDASVSTEDQGNIDRSNLEYSPDITYHMQDLLSRTDLATATDADIWLLAIHTEQVAVANYSESDNQYMQNLMYASYYESLYGGYSGYGYGGSSYNNYYNYMMLAQMMNSANQQQYTTTTELDKDRFYKGILGGPSSTDIEKRPYFRVTFAIPQK